MTRSQEVCGHVFDGVICTLHKGHHACKAGMHFSAGPEYAPAWWKHRWTQVRPMAMMHHHWVTGWCTRCSTRVAAPTAMELYDLAKDATCEYERICRVGHHVHATYAVGVHAVIDYTNWAGSRELRRIRPHAIRFGTNMWHAEPQWLLEATDLDKNATRTFAFATIHDWTEEKLP